METLKSIISQGFGPIQVVIVDDDSTDDTEMRVQSLQGRSNPDIEILYFKQAKSGGPAARNLGTRNTTGEFIVFMDDDDVFSKSFFASHLHTLDSNPAANMSWCKWQRFMRDETHYLLLENRGDFPEQANSPWEAFLRGWELLLQSCVIRRQLVSEVGPWKLHLKKSQDLDYKARLLSADCRLAEADDGSVFYRLHAASITGKLDAGKLVSYVDALDDIESIAMARADYRQLQSLLADYLWGHAFWLYASDCPAEGRRMLNQAKRHDAAVSLRNGPLPSRLLARVGLDHMSGPLLLRLFQLKTRLLGKKALEVQERALKLPR